MSNAELVAGCRRGDAKAQAALYDQFRGRLMGVCRRYSRTTAEEEDIFQEAFLKIFARIHTLHRPEALPGWLHALVVRTAIDYFRRSQPDYDQVPLDPDDRPEPTDDPDALARLELDDLVRLIQTLPTGYRMVVNLYLLDGYEHAEIAQMLGISVGTSKSQLARARRLLQTWLQLQHPTRYAS
jgi:RNA polymerase sigma factor (sigma-70 family)